jgi:hypothetical protein
MFTCVKIRCQERYDLREKENEREREKERERERERESEQGRRGMARQI